MDLKAFSEIVSNIVISLVGINLIVMLPFAIHSEIQDRKGKKHE